MASDRLHNSMKNIASGFISRIAVLLLGMVVRTVFIKELGNDYLSVNGLYSNILGMLSLAELGFGTAVVYSMYKPLAEQDESKLASLMRMYKYVYRVIGWVIFLLGISIIPFMDYIIKEPPDIPSLTFYYILFLLNAMISYWFWGYKKSLLLADQKEYITTQIRIVFSVIKSILQILILIVLHSFTGYLILQILTTIGENLVAALYTKKYYHLSKEEDAQPLGQEERRTIWKNVKALSLSRLGHVILNSSDNIIISSIVGVSWVGLLSNYTLIVDAITGVLCQITSALSASMGNFFISKTKKEGYQLFKRIEFMNSWLYGAASVCLITLFNPFIELWIGEEFLLKEVVVAVIALNFFVQGFMNTIWTFRTTLGLFTQGWIRPLVLAIVNIVMSIILGSFYGIFGILISTFIARASVSLWYDPLIIHKYGFNTSIKPFIKTYMIRIPELLLITCTTLSLRFWIMSYGVTILSFLLLMILTPSVIFLGFWIFTHRCEEYQYLKSTALTRILHRPNK